MTEIGEDLSQELLPLFEEGSVIAALDFLRQRLIRARARLKIGEWQEYCAETFSAKHPANQKLDRLLESGPLASGSGGAARGLLHEPLVLDVIYGFAGVPRLLSPEANMLRDWELALGFCASLRARRAFISRELSELANSVRAPQVLAIGCGHLREAAEALHLMPEARIVAFERDLACIDLIEREYDHPGLVTVSGSWRELLCEPKLGAFDLIYIPTLLDKMDDRQAGALLAGARVLLKPGGRLLAANCTPELGDAAYLEACLDWWPCYRDEEDLAALLNEDAGQNLRGQAVFRDETGGSAFLDLQAL